MASGNSKTRRWEEGRTLVDVVRKASPAAERVAILDTLEPEEGGGDARVSYKTLLKKIKETGIEPPSAACA